MEPTTPGPVDLPLNPPEECDIVMKGGITSGVVYPLAVVELARKYRLRSIGGTSAGAIAAGLTAAAELRRSQGALAGFAELAQLPDFLQKNLASLFQPTAGTRPLFEVLLTWIDKEIPPGRKVPPGTAAKVMRSLKKIVRFHALAFLAGMMQALLLFLLLVSLLAGSLRPGAVLLMLLAALAGGLLGAVLDWAVGGLLAVQANAFGLCPGTGNGGSAPALTPWLTSTLDRIAGKQPGEGPLTFGDLWGHGSAASRNIDLQVMTTNLTHGVPERLPFKSSVYFYNSRELRRFFPEEVVDWMDRHPRASGRPRRRQEQDRLIIPADIRPLPSPADLPVVVAVRMSLSFPVLLSAIPLYAVEQIRDPSTKKWRARLSRCWFSDGGIGSNFPVHFFDQILPSRPTFGINLRPFPSGQEQPSTDQKENVWFPTSTRQGLSPAFHKIDSLFSFVGRIIETMQNWVDNTQIRLPGYRDRVVHVHLTDKEGGMNLTMPSELIGDLTKRGEAAGQKLADEFDWDRHRWTRYRSAMEQLRDKLGGMVGVYDSGLRDFLIQRRFPDRPYPLLERDKPALLRLTDHMMKVGAELRTEGEPFSKEEPPSPEPDLRIMPRR